MPLYISKGTDWLLDLIGERSDGHVDGSGVVGVDCEPFSRENRGLQGECPVRESRVFGISGGDLMALNDRSGDGFVMHLLAGLWG
jgi:hypothetical protein